MKLNIIFLPSLKKELLSRVSMDCRRVKITSISLALALAGDAACAAADSKISKFVFGDNFGVGFGFAGE